MSDRIVAEQALKAAYQKWLIEEEPKANLSLDIKSPAAFTVFAAGWAAHLTHEVDFMATAGENDPWFQEHIWEQYESGIWNIKHPVACKQDGLDHCIVHMWSQLPAVSDSPRVRPGRYRLEMFTENDEVNFKFRKLVGAVG